MSRTWVLRRGSLGDVVLAGRVTGALAPVVFSTSARWLELAERLPGVAEVIEWGCVPDDVERVVDLQGDLRSRWLHRGVSVSKNIVARADLTRRGRVWWRARPARSVVERYAEAAGVSAAATPWLGGHIGGASLVVAPGAAWATKRWPLGHFAALGARWHGPVVVCGGPREAALVHAVADGCGGAAVVEAGFQQTLSVMRRAAVVVANDSGLMHLAGAVGAPVVGLFGSTTAADGFWGGTGIALGLPLSCRPCSRFGRRRCPQGDLACLVDLSVDHVLRAAQQLSGRSS